MAQRNRPLWRGVDTFHLEWAFQVGREKGRMHRLICEEQLVIPTEPTRALYLHLSVMKQLKKYRIDDHQLFIAHFVSGFLAGFGLPEPASLNQGVPF